jgi:hypothetical protein
MNDEPNAALLVSKEAQIRNHMTGRSRLPGGEPRKASQRNKRNMGSAPANISPIWRASMPVLWSGRAGVFRREVGDGEHAEVVIDGRIYRVRLRELN